MFGKKKKIKEEYQYNKETDQAVLKCSICTGEQVAGFRNKVTGHYTEVMLIKNPKDLDAFMEKYDVSTVTKIY